MRANDIFFFLSLALIFLLFWLHFRKKIGRQRATNEVWRQFALRRGLKEQAAGSGGGDASSGGDSRGVRKWTFDDYKPFIAFLGKNNGLPFALECIATEGKPRRVGKVDVTSGEGIRIFTRLRIGLGNIPEGLCVYRESVWSKLGKTLGMQDIATGDSTFDKLFVVKGNDRMEVLNYLTPFRRMALQGLADRFWRLELRDGELVLMQPGQTDRMEQLDQYLADIDQFSSTLRG